MRLEERIWKLRSNLDAQEGGRTRQLVVAVDGGYTNGIVFRNIPERTCLIGRVRKDAKLYSPPVVETGGDALVSMETRCLHQNRSGRMTPLAGNK